MGVGALLVQVVHLGAGVLGVELVEQPYEVHLLLDTGLLVGYKALGELEQTSELVL